MIKPKDEYILFADETKKTPKNPYFCFTGFIIKRCDYEDILVSKINDLKQKHFGKTDIIFHYTDIIKVNLHLLKIQQLEISFGQNLSI